MSFVRTLDYKPIRIFLRLLKHRYWIDDVLVTKNVITVICRQAIDIGLNRWEFNVGEDEEIAEIHRDMWLQCFWWDKWLAFRVGKQPMVLSVHCCCLLPRDLVEVGVDYSMSVFSILQVLSSRAFDTTTTLKLCYLVLSKMIEDIFQDFLYNNEFTGYNSLFTQAESFDIETMFKKLMVKYHGIKKEICLLKEIEERLAESYSTDNEFMEFIMHSDVVTMSILQSVSSAFLRFGSSFGMVENCDLQSIISSCETDTLKSCAGILLKVLKFNNRAQNLKYSWYVVMVVLNMTVLILGYHQKKNFAYYLSLMCAIAKAYSKGSGKEIIYDEPPFSKTAKRYSKIILIVARICCEFYIGSSKESPEKLSYEFQDYGLDFLNSYHHLLNSDNIWFKDLLSNNRISNYRNMILNHINMCPQDFSIETSQYKSNLSESDIISIDNLLSGDLNKFFEDEIFSSFINTMSENLD